MNGNDNRPITYGEHEPPLNDAQKRALEAGATDPAERGTPILATDQAALDQRNADREREAHEHQAQLRQTVNTGPARTAGGHVLQPGAGQGGAVAGQAGTAGQPTTTTTPRVPAAPAADQAAPTANTASSSPATATTEHPLPVDNPEPRE